MFQYNLTQGSSYPSDTHFIYCRRWLDHLIVNTNDNIYKTYSIHIDKSFIDLSKILSTTDKEDFVVTKIQTWFSNYQFRRMSVPDYVILSNDTVYIEAFVHSNSEEVYITIYSLNKEDCKLIESYKKIKRPNASSVHWYFMQPDGKKVCKDIFIEEYTADSLFYPYLPKPLNEYIQDYKDSSSSILVLMGEPGTGKTSFIRHMLNMKETAAFYTFDENVMGSDDFYIEFLTNRNITNLIIEDADIFLASRELNNKIMSKFLNASEGLIKSKDKKIIFTTNIQKINQIDEALIRPGRCYDLIDFRKLTYEESQAIVKKYKLPEIKEKSYTLAELFNRPTGKSKVKQSFGF